MKLSEKIALNATISATLRSSGRFPHLGISEIAELAKEIIEESEMVYSKERSDEANKMLNSCGKMVAQ